jgi:hypothetical protein
MSRKQAVVGIRFMVPMRAKMEWRLPMNVHIAPGRNAALRGGRKWTEPPRRAAFLPKPRGSWVQFAAKTPWVLSPCRRGRGEIAAWLACE